MATRPQGDEYAPFYRAYVDLVPEADVVPVLASQLEVLRGLKRLVPAVREAFAYAPGKWTVREVIGHLGDGERVFGFRAFAFGRADATPLPGFDENAYVAQSSSRTTPIADVVDEVVALRQANLLMLRALTAERWALAGTANGHRITVRALAFVMAGHVRHHLGTLRERYGIDAGD
jgi:hypothetical protein